VRRRVVFEGHLALAVRRTPPRTGLTCCATLRDPSNRGGYVVFPLQKFRSRKEPGHSERRSFGAATTKVTRCGYACTQSLWLGQDDEVLPLVDAHAARHVLDEVPAIGDVITNWGEWNVEQRFAPAAFGQRTTHPPAS
jgi:hypothetical protein